MNRATQIGIVRMQPNVVITLMALAYMKARRWSVLALQ